MDWQNIQAPKELIVAKLNMNKQALNPKVVNPKPWVSHETKGERVSLKISENQSAQCLFQERIHNGSLKNMKKTKHAARSLPR
jgi:hypothetical protein